MLAAGYATRLYPLTKDRPKPLLEVAGKPMLNYIVEKISEVDEIDKIFLITNAQFFRHFTDWKKSYKGKKDIIIVNDNTLSDADKLGAVGDMQFILEKEKIHDDLLVIAGDNLFEFSLNDFVVYFRKKKGNVAALYDIKDKELAKRFGVVSIDSNNKLTGFEEKPKNPKTSLIAICCYLFPKQKLFRIKEYLHIGGNKDAPGHYIEWLY